MKVKELIKKLKDLDQEAEVYSMHPETLESYRVSDNITVEKPALMRRIKSEYIEVGGDHIAPKDLKEGQESITQTRQYWGAWDEEIEYTSNKLPYKDNFRELKPVKGVPDRVVLGITYQA